MGNKYKCEKAHYLKIDEGEKKRELEQDEEVHEI